jgi:putative phosphoribosyl transferase
VLHVRVRSCRGRASSVSDVRRGVVDADDLARAESASVVRGRNGENAQGAGESAVVASAVTTGSPHLVGRREATLLLDHSVLPGELAVPTDAIGVVAFAHGSGSSRLSSRNRFVARVLNDGRIATLLFDLLTDAEELDRRNVFDVELLADRLVGATRWLEGQADVRQLPVGYFGASTGSAAALWAAAELGPSVGAVVSRGGRPDLAERRLGEVASPTLLIVGGADELVLDLNRSTLPLFACEVALRVVPGATHLFEEPGALEQVAELAADWFGRHLTRSGT